jgi:hypothetical protein
MAERQRETVALALCVVAEVSSYPRPEDATVTVVPELDVQRIFSSLEVPRSMTTTKLLAAAPGQFVAAARTKDVSAEPIAVERVVVAPPPSKYLRRKAVTL